MPSLIQKSALFVPNPGSGSAGDDACLVRAAKDEPAAFALLYQRYRHRVYAYLRTRTVTAEDAADLTQQVFLQAFDGLRRYRGQDKEFPAWLFRIARNAASDYWRSTRTTVPWEYLPESLQPQSDLNLEATVLRQEEVEGLRAILSTLSPDAQELLALRFGADLTVVQIAATIGKSEAATRKRLSRIFQSLKEQYRESL